MAGTINPSVVTSGGNPWGGGSVTSSSAGKPPKSFWGFVGNVWGEAKTITKGLGSLVGTVVHDSWNAARQSVLRLPWTDPEEIAARQAGQTADPSGLFKETVPGTGSFVFDDIYRVAAGSGEQQSMLAKDYTDRWGPGANEEGEKGVLGGNVDPLYEHPLSFITDALTVLTLGGYTAAKGGQFAGKLGAVADASTTAGRGGKLLNAIQGTARRTLIPSTGRVQVTGAAFNPVRRLLYQNRYAQMTSRSNEWMTARAGKFAEMADAAGVSAPAAARYVAKANEYRAMVEHAQSLGATRVMRRWADEKMLRKYVDRAVGAAVGKTQLIPDAVDRSFVDNLGDLDPDLVGPDELDMALRGTDTDLTADHIVAREGHGVRMNEVFDPESVPAATFGDRPITWGEAFDAPDAAPVTPYVLPLDNVDPVKHADFVKRRDEVFAAGADPQYAYHYSPASKMEKLREEGLLPARPADANIDPTAATGVYFGGNARDAYQSLPMKSGRDAALLRVKRDLTSEAGTGFKVGQKVKLTNEGSTVTIVQVKGDGNLVVRKQKTEWLVGPEDVERPGSITPTGGIQGKNFNELISPNAVGPKDIEVLGADGRWAPLVPEPGRTTYSSGFPAVDHAVDIAHAKRTSRGLPPDDEQFDHIASYMDDPDNPIHQRFLSMVDSEKTESLRNGVFVNNHLARYGMTQYWKTSDGVHVDGYLEVTPDGHLTSVTAGEKQGRGVYKELLLKHWDETGIDSEEAIIAEAYRQSMSAKGAAAYRSAAGERLGQIDKWGEVIDESIKVRTPKLRTAFNDGSVTFRKKGKRSWARKAELVVGRRAVTDGEGYRVIHEDAFDGKKQQGLIDRLSAATGDKVRRIDPDVDAPGPDGSRELRVIMEAADDQHPYEVSFVTGDAAKVFDATVNTRQLYNTAAVLARRGVSIGDDAHNIKYLEGLQQPLWEGVTDNLRVARGGPAPADLRARINRFRVDNYRETTDKLLGRGLTPKSAFENAWMDVSTTTARGAERPVTWRAARRRSSWLTHTHVRVRWLRCTPP